MLGKRSGTLAALAIVLVNGPMPASAQHCPTTDQSIRIVPGASRGRDWSSWDVVACARTGVIDWGVSFSRIESDFSPRPIRQIGIGAEVDLAWNIVSAVITVERFTHPDQFDPVWKTTSTERTTRSMGAVVAGFTEPVGHLVIRGAAGPALAYRVARREVSGSEVRRGESSSVLGAIGWLQVAWDRLAGGIEFDSDMGESGDAGLRFYLSLGAL